MTATTALSPHLGAEVALRETRGMRDGGTTDPTVDLADPAFLTTCAEALRWRGLLLIRGAGLDDEQQLRFTHALSGVSGRVVSLEGMSTWRLDGASEPVPARATVLTARRVAMLGGNTEFADTYAAWADLAPSERKRYEGLRVVHTVGAAQRRERPLVWRRRDGRTSLLLGATADHVVGLRPAEGRALLAELLAWVTQLRFCYRHDWEVGDLVAWDSTAILHRVLPYSVRSDRLLHRTSATGDEETS